MTIVKNRRASALVMVLIVLAISGLMTIQTIRTMLVVRRSHAHQAELRQAREVLAFVRKSVQPELNSGSIETQSYNIEVDGSVFARVDVKAREGDGGRAACRIEVRYPWNESTDSQDRSAKQVDANGILNTNGNLEAWTVTWQSELWESPGSDAESTQEQND